MKEETMFEKFSGESKTARMPVVPVHMPGTGEGIIIDAVGDIAFSLQFPMEGVFLRHAGSDLQFVDTNGGSVTLRGYFTNQPEDLDSRIQFYSDGYAYTSKGFFEAFPFEFAESETAAGAIDAPASGGLGEFAEMPEQLITGIGRLGADDPDVFDGHRSGMAADIGEAGELGRETPLPPPYPEMGHDSVQEGGGSSNPEPEPEPEPEPVERPGNDRFVIHTGNTTSAINNAVIAGIVTANDTDPDSTIVSVSNGKYGTATFNPETGEVTYTLNSNAAAQMGGGTGQIVDTITYIAVDSNGNTYEKTVEVVIVRQVYGSGQYVSDGQIEGEVHRFTVETTGDGKSGTLEIVLGAGDDIVEATAKMQNMEIDLGAGNNRFTMTATGRALDNTVVSAGDGDNAIWVEGSRGLDIKSYIKTGSGNDTIQVIGKSDYGMNDGAYIDAGSGDNQVTVTGGNYAMYSATVTTGDGSDTIRIQGNNGAAMASNSTVSSGAGDDYVIVHGSIREAWWISASATT